jgi:type I restriction enzyme M protein
MAGIERDNPSLKGVLPKDYARPALDKLRLGQLIDLISNITVGDVESRAKDVLGRVYEYFLSQFASAEGKKGGEFYTPRCVVKLLVEMLEPYKGRVYDPCCGSSGMFVQSVEFIRAHTGGNGNRAKARSDISIYGQESNYTTWRLARMNLAIRGIDGQIAHGDSFHNDRFPDLKADYILANPPFNVSDWRGDLLMMDQRWQFGVPPAGNANFAWVQHISHHLAPTGLAGFVLANGSMSSNQSSEGEIRKNLIEGDLVDCMVALPGQLFYSTQIPACLWFLARDKSGKSPSPRWSRAGVGVDVSATAAARYCSSTPASSVAWSTAPTANSPTKRSRASPAPITPGAARRTQATTPTSPASARARRWRTSASTAMYSRPAATSAPRRRRTTASRSRRRCGGSQRNCVNSTPRLGGWTRRSGIT